MVVENEASSASSAQIEQKTENQKLDHLVSIIVNRLFNNNQVFLRSLNDVSQALIQLVDLVKRADFNTCSPLLTNSFFSMIYNLIELKLHSNESKYLDACLLNDLAECLIGCIGKMNTINTVRHICFRKKIINFIVFKLFLVIVFVLFILVHESNNSKRTHLRN